MWILLLLAATVRSFAHISLGFFRSQQNGAVTRMWRSCRVQLSHKERAIGVVRCKKEGMLLQPLRWRCVDCVIHHERDVREEKHYMNVARTRVIMACELYCCLLPQCKALRVCRSGFPDRNASNSPTTLASFVCSKFLTGFNSTLQNFIFDTWFARQRNRRNDISMWIGYR